MSDLSANRRTVLILDGDLAFVFWLGQTLHEAGHLAYPAKSGKDGTALVNRLKLKVDLLVVGHGPAGVVELAKVLRRSQHRLKVLAAVAAGEDPGSIIQGADAILYKPSTVSTASTIEWLHAIEGLWSNERTLNPKFHTR